MSPYLTFTLKPNMVPVELQAAFPDLEAISQRIYTCAPRGKRSVWDSEVMVIYALASEYNRSGANLLDIGTYHGYTAAAMALAAPRAKVVTLNPKSWEWNTARKNLDEIPNATPLLLRSFDLLNIYQGPNLDMIFVDGDHVRARDDLPWWNFLNTGGLMLFHDYGTEGIQGRGARPVMDAIQELKKLLKRDFDVLALDNRQSGMAGFYRKQDDPLIKLK